ncbi:MAG: hypothetical protein L0220_27725 [Acidobacteria bacterium]|nr:hypothetical protein [Acidobacteriota bacterium]
MRRTNGLKRPQYSLELFVADGVIICLLTVAGERVISAQGDEIAPGANLEVVGVPIRCIGPDL